MSKNWVLLRGLARGVGHWATFPERIQKAFPQDHFEFLDLPGNGGHFKKNSPLTVAEMMQEVRDSSSLVRAGTPIQLVAMSLGGMVATEWARQFPGEVERLCLINTSAANFGKFYERLRPGNLPKLAKIFRTSSVCERERRILDMVSNSESRQLEVLSQWTQESEKHPVSAKNFIRQLVAASRFHFPQQAPTKTLLLASAKDAFVAAACTERLSRSWQCPVSLHPWAGHDLALDDPEWLLDCLKNMQKL